jgi:hypothetical protein
MKPCLITFMWRTREVPKPIKTNFIDIKIQPITWFVCSIIPNHFKVFIDHDYLRIL